MRERSSLFIRQIRSVLELTVLYSPRPRHLGMTSLLDLREVSIKWWEDLLGVEDSVGRRRRDPPTIAYQHTVLAAVSSSRLLSPGSTSWTVFHSLARPAVCMALNHRSFLCIPLSSSFNTFIAGADNLVFQTDYVNQSMMMTFRDITLYVLTHFSTHEMLNRCFWRFTLSRGWPDTWLFDHLPP